MMSRTLLGCVTFLLLICTTCYARHVISIHSSVPLEFSSLAWDPIAQYFVVGSSKSPTVYAIPDDGMGKRLLSESFSNSTDVSVSALAVDHTRRRLIVAFSNPSFVAAYDMESYKRIFAVPLPELNGAPGGVAADVKSGEVFVSSVNRGIILKVGTERAQQKVLSEFEISGDQGLGLGGLVHTDHGYIIVVQPTTGKIFKVDSNEGTSEDVLSGDSSQPLAPEGHGIVLCSDLSAVVFTNKILLSIKSDDTWEQADAEQKLTLDKHATVVAVARREAATYVLAMSNDGFFRIEEAVLQEGTWRQYVIFTCVITMAVYGMGFGYWISYHTNLPILLFQRCFPNCIDDSFY